MDPYEALGIDPSFDGDLRALRNRLVKQYSEAGATPDEERMKAINVAYESLRDGHVARVVPASRVVFRGGPGSSFVLDGRRFVLARPPREPAAIAAPVLAAGLVVLVFGWVGLAVGGAVWVLWRQLTRRW
ncbi:J domain-containing protein [Solirubrobacter phytolaccae]|uniref:J domain-containing protein n=1 Tax=Solirubrobacter phytolaccae TaxID=1404360 RepID=A0A9X3S6A3_9ACTN|nr:J domain-containing protein [Solirubrobacter phytolaccae]MDA0178863.1 J domain-containing protein [Solirubrobacter phytolaccae]